MADSAQASVDEIASALKVLERHPDFRVLRRLGAGTEVSVKLGGTPLRAAIVDTETTGTGPDDRIVELALLVFEYEPATGTIGRIVDTYDGLEDPGWPIPPEATAIHGITDEMVAGRALDEARIRSLLEGLTLVIAHNAAFDRPFLERRLQDFAALPWGCSYAQIPWGEEGFAGAKLEYLAMASGFFYEAHRGEADCQALLELLRRPLPRSGGSAFGSLLKAAQEPAYALWALASPYEKKDALKARGYRWDGERRCWYLLTSRDALKSEAFWMKAEVFAGRACRIEVERLDATTRFSGRPGPRKSKVI